MVIDLAVGFPIADDDGAAKVDAGNNGRSESIFKDRGAVVGNDDGRFAVLVPVVNEPFQRGACKVRVLDLVILVQHQKIRRLVSLHDIGF